MADKLHYVVVHPDGRECPCELTPWVKQHKARTAAEHAARAFNLTTSRANPQQVKLKVYRLDIEKGVLVRQFVGEESVMPYLEKMTQAEYDQEMASLLEELPIAFHNFVNREAWDQGHSSGLEEVINIAGRLVYGLIGPIKAYEDTRGTSR